MFCFKQKKYYIFIMQQARRFLCESKSPSQFIQDYFDLSQYKTNFFIQRNKLGNVSTDNLLKITSFCEEHGFSKSDIKDRPAILRSHPTTIDQYYNVLGEGGFTNINLHILTKFRTICKKTVRELKELLFLNPEIDMAKNFIQHLSPCPQDLYVNVSELNTFSEIHTSILTEYLKWRLEMSHEQILKLLKTHHSILRKSFKYLCENICFANEIGFTNEKMLKYGYILHAFPKHYRTTLEMFPEVGGISMKRAMRMYPKIIATSPTNIEKILDVLKKHEISDEAIGKRLNILNLTPETVEYRLNELKNQADLNALLHNPDILRLVVHHNRAKSRLAFLKQLQLKCATVSILGKDDIKFDMHIREGKDENSFTDTYAFIKGIFMREPHEFESTLKRHPYYLQVPLAAMKETYNYLKSEHFNDNAILKVLYILLYPKEKIKNCFPEIRNYEKSRNMTLSQVNRLNLVLYFIEKEHHFSGDGVWQKLEHEESLNSDNEIK